MEDVEITVGDRLKHLRLEAGLTKYALAKKVGISDVSVGYWERGISKTINHLLLMRLAEALNVTVSELVGDPQLSTHESALLTQHAETLQRMARQAPSEESSALERAADYLHNEAGKLSGHA